MRFSRTGLAFLFWASGVLLTESTAATTSGVPAQQNNALVSIVGTITSFDKNNSVAIVKSEQNSNDLQYAVIDPAVASELDNALAGDVLAFVSDSSKTPPSIVKISKLNRPIGVVVRISALTCSLLIVYGAAWTMLRKNPRSFIIGVDGRLSNSQTQLAIWFAALAAVYGAALFLRFGYWRLIGGIGISQNLMWVTGLSAFSFGGAKVITSQKIVDAKARGIPDGGKPAAAPAAARLTDLVQNDRSQADLGDFQMILVTVVAAAIFLVTAFQFLALLQFSETIQLPDIDSTLLSSFGIGQGAYLIKKAALPPGDG